jgi:hypothetical protein
MPNTINNSILGQSQTNPKAMQIFNKPDTDSRAISIVGGPTSVTPNFMFDHAYLTYFCPTGNGLPVTFFFPIKYENRSLHHLCLNNSRSNWPRTFTFSPDYVFLDDPTNTSRTYIVAPGKKQVWFGTIINGKFYLRVESDSTN